MLDHRWDDYIAEKRDQAMKAFLQTDTLTASDQWPNVKPTLFFANVRNNILYPSRINQGASTNFCGYAAMTHLLLKYHPEIYLQEILSLYRRGNAKLEKRNLDPSEKVKMAAGTLKNKGELDILHADQLWFLTLADQFRGYMNFFDQSYKRGDENKLWASTNYGKFNRMLRHFTEDEIKAVGSDFIRPFKNDYYTYLSEQLRIGVVILYVNSKFLYPHKFFFLRLRAPTHFIVLYDIYRSGDRMEMQYWDYGLRTQQTISRKNLRKLIFGVTTITSPK
ncbi:hypothetical protein FPE01S_04_03980 [Flavihumibacter petaseus NBRC 106054]|uniref:Peptidase C39-like domain-containing protein n=2 Tax=Flavihumibacter TaxID=1004301 RepID=A0A0E9N731_9BACT|nr:hypothetical protein FPE01S_04_03980 [Flavihumibacter petaseus NBRC 106054]